MRLHSYKAADHHWLRLVVNQYPNERPIGLALQVRHRVLSLVWRGPASMSDKKRKALQRAADERVMDRELAALIDGSDG